MTSVAKVRAFGFAGGQAVTVACACEHCGHEFESEPDGGHRLLCGDATDPEALDRALEGETAQLCLTDPPYGIGEAYASHHDSREGLTHLVDRFLPTVRERCEVVLLTPGNRHQRLYPQPEWTLAWFVPAGTGANPWGFTCWHAILAYGNDPFLKNRKGSRPDAFVMTESAENSLGHPCPKPVGVWSWLLERGSLRAGDIVLDPFAGSGTTIIAAEKLGRRCAAVELAPEYVDVAVIRWSKFTGRLAVLAEGGRTFEEVAAARSNPA
jgi:DNA methylase